MKFRLVALPLCLLAGLTGCASIVDGSTETVTVQTANGPGALAGAQCALDNKKGNWVVTTPGSVTVHRGSEALEVKCTKDGYAPATDMVSAATNNVVYWNILLGGGVGATTDTVSGAAWKYPQTITVPMQPVPSASVASNAPAT
jgi:hypothetical protein